MPSWTNPLHCILLLRTCFSRTVVCGRIWCIYMDGGFLHRITHSQICVLVFTHNISTSVYIYRSTSVFRSLFVAAVMRWISAPRAWEKTVASWPVSVVLWSGRHVPFFSVCTRSDLALSIPPTCPTLEKCDSSLANHPLCSPPISLARPALGQ